MKYLFLLLCLGYSAIATAQAPRPSEDPVAESDSISKKVPADLLFRENRESLFRISPDGKYFAEIIADERVSDLVIIDIKKYQVYKHVPLEQKYIDQLYWLNNSRLIFQSRGKIYVIDKDGSNSKQLVGRVDRSQELSYGNFFRSLRYNTVLNTLPKKEDAVMVETYDYTGYADVQLVNLFTGEKIKLIDGSDKKINGWITDRRGEVRLGLKLDDGRINYYLRDLVSGDVEPLNIILDGKEYSLEARADNLMDHEVAFVGFGYDPDIIYINSIVGSDTRKLLAYNLASNRVEKVLIDDKTFDAGGMNGENVQLLFDDKNQKYAGARYEAMTPVYKWEDQGFKQLHSILHKAFTGYMNDIIDVDAANENFVVAQWSDTKAGNIGVFNKKDSSYNVMRYRNEELDKYNLSSSRPFSFQSRDGKQISGYLNLPLEYNKDSLKGLVVIPHGGPWARDSFGLEGFSQFFASRGYVTVRINFRGSTGFGKEHLKAGISGMNTVMIDDIADGAKYVASKFHLDTSKIFIFGHSYGGYATYMSLLRYPELYRRGVVLSAPTDIKSWMKMLKKEDENFSYDFWNTALGDRGSRYLKEISPINYAEDFDKPLLIVHGRFDEIVPVEQAQDMEKELLKNGKEVSLRIIEGEGHSLRDGNSMGYILELADKFFVDSLNTSDKIQ